MFPSQVTLRPQACKVQQSAKETYRTRDKQTKMEKTKRGVTDDRSYFEKLDNASGKRNKESIVLIDGIPEKPRSRNPEDFSDTRYMAIVNQFVFSLSAFTMLEFEAYKKSCCLQNLCPGGSETSLRTHLDVTTQ